MTINPSPSSTYKVGHLTTVDLSLRFLVKPQLLAVIEAGGDAIGISAPGPWVTELEEEGIRHIPLNASTRGMSLGSDLRAAAQLWRALRREDLTVLHTHNPKPGLYGRVLGRLAGVPLVVNTMHGFYATDDDPVPKRALVYTLEGIAARFSDVELHQNPEDLDLAKKLRIVPRDKGHLLGNGVDLARFDPESVESGARTRIRAEIGVDDSQILVGVVGRLVAEKGFPELFEAMSRLGPDFRLVAIGPDDPEKADALPRDMIARAGEAGVSFLGMRTDVDELYSAMDIFVLPSHREGFPRAAMEAAAMGLPIVATDIRGCRQVVDEGVNGLLVPVLHPVELAAAIQRLGEDETTRRSMGQASRQIAQERFDERRVVEVVMESYRNGLSEKGLGHLFPASDPEPNVTLRSAVPGDEAALAGLHMSEIDTGFLPSLGRRFMQVLYEAMIRWQGSVVIVADDAGVPVGFVSGVSDVGAFYRHFVRAHWLRATWAALPRVLRPSVIGPAWEALRYGSSDLGEVDAELLSMSVAPRARGRGLSTDLGQRFLSQMAQSGCDSVRVVVASENSTAIGAYRKLGFADRSRIEVHAGESSEVLVWQA